MADKVQEEGLAGAAEREPTVEEVAAELVTAEVADVTITLPEGQLAAAEAERLRSVAGSAAEALVAARSMVVRNADEQAAAIELGASVRRNLAQSEEARKALTKPLRDHVAFINDQFKPTTEAYEKARVELDGKVLAFQREEQERAAAERRRIEEEQAAERERIAEEQRQREAAAQAEREKAAREAEQRAAEARKAQEEAARRARELDQELAASPDRVLRLMLLPGRDPDKAKRAQAVLDSREAARNAERARIEQEEAAAREAEARAAEQAAREHVVPDLPQVAVEVARPVGLSGKGSVRQVWKYELTDMVALCRAIGEGRVPAEFVTLTGEVNKAVKRKDAPLRDVPGLRIFPDDSLSVRS